MFEQAFVSWCFFEAIGKRVHAWREFCQPFEQPGMGCLHNRCVEVFEGKPCALHCWTRLCGQDTDLWVLSVHISGSSVKAILLAFYGDVSAIQFDRYSEIHGSIIQNSQQVDFSLVFWKVPFLLLLFKFHLARLFHLVHQSIIDLWVTKPPVVLLCSRFRDGTWRDNKLRHLGGKMGINRKEHELIWISMKTMVPNSCGFLMIKSKLNYLLCNNVLHVRFTKRLTIFQEFLSCE